MRGLQAGRRCYCDIGGRAAGAVLLQRCVNPHICIHTQTHTTHLDDDFGQPLDLSLGHLHNP